MSPEISEAGIPMEHPNARTGQRLRLPGLAGRARRRAVMVASGCAAVALAATPLITHTPATSDRLNPLDPTARLVTALGPHVVVYSVPTWSAPTKKHKDHKKKTDSDSNSGDSGSAGSDGTSVSNTVNGVEVGGAETYNNHTDSDSSSNEKSSSSTDTGISNSPVQLENNTGAGASDLDPSGRSEKSDNSGSSGIPLAGQITSSSAGAEPAVLLMRVSCPSSIAAGTVCLQVTSSNGTPTSLPTSTNAASLPISPTLPSGSAPGQTVGRAAHAYLSTLESQSGKKIELTGYSFQDNQGGNNAKISCPQIHQQAGGTGTYEDPITVASGGKSGGSSADGVKCGDRFYIPAVARYVIVEDTGNTPNKSMPHLDMYVADDPQKSCMNKISGTVTAIPHPPPGLPVLVGPIGNHGSCKLPGDG